MEGILSLVHFVLDASSEQVDGSAVLKVKTMIVGEEITCDFALEVTLWHTDHRSRVFGGRGSDEYTRPELVGM